MLKKLIKKKIIDHIKRVKNYFQLRNFEFVILINNWNIIFLKEPIFMFICFFLIIFTRNRIYNLFSLEWIIKDKTVQTIQLFV